MLMSSADQCEELLSSSDSEDSGPVSPLLTAFSLISLNAWPSSFHTNEAVPGGVAGGVLTDLGVCVGVFDNGLA